MPAVEMRHYRREVRRVKRNNAELHSQCCDFQYKLQVGKMLQDEAAFYYPHNVDFRGRAYTMHPYVAQCSTSRPVPDEVGWGLCSGDERAEGCNDGPPVRSRRVISAKARHCVERGALSRWRWAEQVPQPSGLGRVARLPAVRGEPPAG